jgi:hypothetical protein
MPRVRIAEYAKLALSHTCSMFSARECGYLAVKMKLAQVKIPRSLVVLHWATMRNRGTL